MTALPRILVAVLIVIASAIGLARLIRVSVPPPIEPPELGDVTLGAPAPAPPKPQAQILAPAKTAPPLPAAAEPARPVDGAPADKPPPPAPVPLPAAPPQLSDQEFYARFSPAVIQIFCNTPQEIFAASGVIVSERGLILTNAHVAEVIKRAGETNCQARGGNPAERFAGIEIVFSASTTLKIASTNVPQRDVAFLRLVKPNKPFAAASAGLAFAERGATLLTLGYPSEFLQGAAAVANSNLVFSSLRVDGYGDLDGDPATAEAYVSRGGIVLQQGSSGTALFTRSGILAGLIFATTKGDTTASREGLALTMPYIERILRLEAGQGLAEFIAGH